MRDFVFVDTETTGLDPEKDLLVELSYAVNIEPVVGPLFFGVEEVNDFIDELIGFTKRGIAGNISTPAKFAKFSKDTQGHTMVAANPTFDAAFLKRHGLFEFHYRMIDLSAFAMGILDLPEMPGQHEVVNQLRNRGYGIPEADHTSRNDVLALQASFFALQDYRRTLS